MIEHVLGLDLSITAPGVGDVARAPDGTTSARCRTEGGRSPENPTLAQRGAQIRNLRARCVPPAAWVDDRGEHRVVLAVLEAPSYGSTTYRDREGKQKPLPGLWDRAGLYWAVVLLLQHRGIPVATTPPATVKKWATGSGRATKREMTYAAGEMWPGVLIRDHNAADGLLVASAGAARLGWPLLLDPFVAATRAASLDNMTWPADTPPRVSTP